MVKKCCLATFVVLSVASGGTVSADLPPVPEAVGGFRSPVDFAPSSAGYRFAQKALKKDKDGKWVSAYSCPSIIYHPGEDVNHPDGGYSDYGKPVYAVADGVVISISKDSWKAILIKHRYAGKTYYSLYAHVQKDDKPPRVKVGDVVKKGDVIAYIGDSGAKDNSHLHFEIRNENHEDPEDVDYFCGNTSEEKVRRMYEDPMKFVQEHGPYEELVIPATDICNESPCTVSTWQFSNGELFGWYPAGDCLAAKKWFRLSRTEDGALTPTTFTEAYYPCQCR